MSVRTKTTLRICSVSRAEPLTDIAIASSVIPLICRGGILSTVVTTEPETRRVPHDSAVDNSNLRTHTTVKFFFFTFQIQRENGVDRFALIAPIFTDFIVDSIQLGKGIDRFQRALLLLF